MVVNDIDVTVNGLNDISEQEIVNYIDYVQAQTKEKVNSLKLSATKDGQVDIRYELQPQNSSASAASRATSSAPSTAGTTPSALKSTTASSTACID